MRFIVGSAGDSSETGVFVVKGDQAFNASALAPEIGPDLSALVGDPALMDRLAGLDEPSVPVADIKPTLPIARPGKVVCLGLNYVDHAKEGGNPVGEYPAFFLRVPTSLIPAEAPILRPKVSDRLDYEAELMVIVGKGGRHIAEADALDHVFGYTLFNDGSVRDYQRKTSQWTAGKNFDATGPIGPVVVTPDELPAGASGLRIQSRLNGQVMQDANTRNMMFTVPWTLATLSEGMTLEPGDMIAFGTPSGVGYARTPPVFMKPGDVVEIEVEGIGVLRNPIEAEGAT